MVNVDEVYTAHDAKACASLSVKAVLRQVALVAGLLLLVVAKSVLGSNAAVAGAAVDAATSPMADDVSDGVYFLVRVPKTGSTTFAEVRALGLPNACHQPITHHGSKISAMFRYIVNGRNGRLRKNIGSVTLR